MIFPHDQLQRKSFQKLPLKVFIKAITLAVIKVLLKAAAKRKLVSLIK